MYFLFFYAKMIYYYLYLNKYIYYALKIIILFIYNYINIFILVF